MLVAALGRLLWRGLRIAPPRCPKVTSVPITDWARARAHNTRRYEPPSSASLVYRDGAMLNFALTEFYEVREL
jgi:hypothetical protein